MSPDSGQDVTFGQMLRTARVAAGFMTIRAWADALSGFGVIYGEDTLGRYEKDQRKPAREDLLVICSILAKFNGLHDVRDVNCLLWLLDLRNLNEGEVAEHFADLALTAALDNMPPQPPYDRLVGRDALIDELSEQLRDAGAKQVIVLSGLGGIGKTALAYELVRWIMRDNVFEQLAWESLKSEEFTGVERRERMQQSLDLRAVLLRISRQLDLTLPPDVSLDVLKSALRSHLQQTPCLVVVDNLESLPAVREIAYELYQLVSPPASIQPSRILITSRQRLTEEPYLVDYQVHGLDEGATDDLLEVEIITRNLPELHRIPDVQRKRIYTITGGMPLAIKLLVSQFALGINMDEALTRLEGAVDEEELYRFIYMALWAKLGLHAQMVIGAAAAYGHSVDKDMLIGTSGVPDAAFFAAVRELVRMALIDPNLLPELRLQRYSIHPMTRWFVNAPLVEIWNQQKRNQSAADGG